jgi:hypothetical protein
MLDRMDTKTAAWTEDEITVLLRRTRAYPSHRAGTLSGKPVIRGTRSVDCPDVGLLLLRRGCPVRDEPLDRRVFGEVENFARTG